MTVTQQGTASFTISAAGIKGSVSATLALSVPNVALTGTVTLTTDTTLPVAYLRVEVASAKLTVVGQELSGSIVVERSGTELKLTVTDGAINLAGGAVKVEAINGNLTLAPARVSGTLSATLAVSAGDLQLGGSFALKIDTAAPYLKVDAVGVTVRVAGQRLSADVSIEQLTTSAGPTVKLALANVNLALGDGKQDLLTLTGGSGFWLIRSGGVAGRVQGTVALQNVPGVTLQGTLGLEVNTTNADVNETFTLNGFETKLEIAASRKFAVSGTGVTLALAGVSLSGDFVFTKDTNKTRLDISNAEIAISSGTTRLIAVTIATGFLELATSPGKTTGGVTGSITAAITVDIPNVAFDGAFKVDFDTTPATPTFAVASTGTVTLSIAGQTLSATSITLSKNAQGVTSPSPAWP